jgi:hypothetical protein
MHDWSMHADKRWAATAQFRENRYCVDAPTPTTPSATLKILKEPGVIAGFDFPIGIPAAYAARLGLTSFLELLALLGQAELGASLWTSFFDVARAKSEISLHRPFYPHNPGGRRREHLVEMLGLGSPQDLFRECELAPGRQACPLFWTLGGNQVGKGALTGWREVLLPARATKLIDLWPYDGTLSEILARGRSVIVETYPGDVYPYVGATLPATKEGRGKRVQSSRAQCAPGILAWAQVARVDFSEKLVAELHDGFASAPDGEDRFDAVIGVLGMISVFQKTRPSGPAELRKCLPVEGWILGRAG